MRFETPGSKIEKTPAVPSARSGSVPATLLRSTILAWILLVLPGLWPVWPLFVRQDPTALADPLRFILDQFGFVASFLLALVLTFTPLRVLFPRSPSALALNRHRRLVGVAAAVYAGLHFTMHLIYEGGPAILASDIKKPFLVSGLVSLTILTTLGITSLRAAVRRLGAKRWKNLHRLAYVAVALVAYHQATAPKVFPVWILWIYVPLAMLELMRFLKRFIPNTMTESRQPRTP